jgi:hypothetical protein
MFEFDTPEKAMYPTCKHKQTTKLHHPAGLAICKSCGYGFYNNCSIIKPYQTSEFVVKDMPDYIDRQIVDLFNNADYKLDCNSELISEECRETMIDQLIKRSKIMKLNEECQYLSIYLWDYFYSKNSARHFGQKKKCDIYNATALLLAAKMREVDLKTPYASEIRKLKDNSFTKKDLKDAEIVLANFFDWNFLFFTVYDYVQHCLNVGVLFGSDS